MTARFWYNKAMLADRLQKIYREAGAEALFIEQDFLRRYLTGFYSTDGYVTLTADGCTFFADARYLEAAQRELAGSGIAVKEGVLKEALEEIAPYHNIGVPKAFTTLARAEGLTEKGFTLVDCMPALKNAMTIKTPQEISLIARACEIAEDALTATLPKLKEGMTESELAAILEYEMRLLGASGVSFETIVGFGANGSVPHHETGNTKLKFGDAVLIDFGCKYGGYCSDCTRTFLFGDDKRHEEFKKIYGCVLDAHMRVLEQTREGMTGREADAIARHALAEKGLDKYFTHSLGHGIGLQIHEYPVLAPRSEEKLVNGMVFSDEPGVYLAGRLGIRIEDSAYMEGGVTHTFMKKLGKKLLIL